jgi:hypothetical protein
VDNHGTVAIAVIAVLLVLTLTALLLVRLNDRRR